MGKLREIKMPRKKKKTTEDPFKDVPDIDEIIRQHEEPDRLEELAKHNPELLQRYETPEIMKVEPPKYDPPISSTTMPIIKEDTMHEPYKKTTWQKVKKTASTIALSIGIAYGAINLYQGLTIEDTINEHDGQEYIMKFEPNEKRALPYQISIENHTYSRLRDLILRMEDDQKKPFSEQDIYNLVLRMNTENFSKLDLSEVETAWMKYETEKMTRVEK